MKKTILLDQTKTPDGKVLSLWKHDQVYSLRIDGIELMSTRRHTSEDKLAEVTCEPLRGKKVRILIGGLGFGFTLRAALPLLSKSSEIVVAEILPAVVAWNQNLDYDLCAKSLADPRVQIRMADAVSVIEQSPAAFDAILLDIDNGADSLVVKSNGRLYQEAGLQHTARALRKDGLVCFWSASEDPAFERQLKRAGFDVEVHREAAHPSGGGWYYLYLGRLRARHTPR